MTIKQRSDRCLLAAFSIAVLLLHVFYIERTHGPIVYADEMGYWGHAANLTGNIWSGVMDGMPWYAFGYSFLLAPIFFVTTDMELMYRTAVALNALLELFSFWLAYKTVRQLREDKTDVAGATAIAFTAVSYTSYIFHAHIAWSETLLSFLMWLILYEILLLEKSPELWKAFLLGVTVGVSYIVHSRMLAVIAAVLLTLAFLLWRKIIHARHLLSTFVVIALALGVSLEISRGFHTLVNDSAMLRELGLHIEFSRDNTLSDQIAKAGQIFTGDGFRKLMIGMTGQVWHLLSASYLLAGFGVLFCVKMAVRGVREHKNVGVYLFPVYAALFTIPMTSLFFINYQYDAKAGRVRIDTLFFGRYIDLFVGLLLLMALVWLYDQVRAGACLRSILAVGIVYTAASGFMYLSLRGFDDFYLNTVDESALYIFHWLGDFAVWKCTLIAFVGCVLCLLCMFVKLPERTGRYLACMLLVFLFSVTALKCMRFTIRGENDHTLLYTELYEYLADNTEEREPVFTFARNKFAYDLQTRLVDRMVISIGTDQEELIKEAQYLVMSEQDYEGFASSKYTVCLLTEGYVVLRKE